MAGGRPAASGCQLRDTSPTRRSRIPGPGRLCLLAVARAARLLVIGCVGSIMTLGRWQEAAEREAERRLVRLTGDALASEVSPPPSALKPHNNVRESARWKRCNITAHCSCLRRVRCHSLYNLPHRELLYPRAELTRKRGSEAYKKLITSFITVITVISRPRVGWRLITALLSRRGCEGLLSFFFFRVFGKTEESMSI